jgi:hypothetical protein
MKAYKVHFKHHHQLQITRAWAIVVAESEEEAMKCMRLNFVGKNRINKPAMPGYAHVERVEELCDIKGNATLLEFDFIPLNNPWYNKG